ncbi:DUF3995 domain-containing protein [Paenibacillus albiflavus]|uniref:DUF3995 domain-containing protein n=1 Tax=Paenibacillus albiflavus TaxID=2545760 RepID=A0A4R4EDQ4_9BACL|nr:DUF3995 domain-containing protein [Paenibacillus albiflavus]TCZ78124.1 DUF3995 domain-containing protein [Paenibacillus albiflavus]
MVSFFTWVVGGILFLLSGIHLYWMAGGRRGALAAIPSKGSELLFRPTNVATGIVAGALALAGWFVLELGEVVEWLLFPDWVFIYGGWVLSAVFIIRAIGDFRWIGFFKKQKGTLFAKWDTMLYSPLCLFIGICLIFLTKGRL